MEGRKEASYKDLERNNNEIVQSNTEETTLSYGNGKTLDKKYKFVKNIVTPAHDLNLEVEKDDIEELLKCKIMN